MPTLTPGRKMVALKYMKKVAFVVIAVMVGTVGTAHADKRVKKPKLWQQCFKNALPSIANLGGVELPTAAKFDDKTSGEALGNPTKRSYYFTVRGKSQREIGQFFFNQKLVPISGQPATALPRTVFQLSADATSTLTVQCDASDEVMCAIEFRFAPKNLAAAKCPTLGTPNEMAPRSVVAAALPIEWTRDYRNSTEADWKTFFAKHPPTEAGLGLVLHPALRFDAAASAAPSHRGGKRGRFTYVFNLKTEQRQTVVDWYTASLPGVEVVPLDKAGSMAMNANADDQLLFNCDKKGCVLTMSLVRADNTADDSNPPRHAGPRGRSL